MKAKRSSRENIVVIALIFLCIIVFAAGTYLATRGRSTIVVGVASSGEPLAITSTPLTEEQAGETSSDPIQDTLAEILKQKKPPRPLGIRRDEIQPIYESEGLVFVKSAALDLQVRTAGTMPPGLIIVELIGPDENLTRASVIVGLEDPPAELINHFNLMLRMIKLVAPDWQEGPVWLQTGLNAIASADPIVYEEKATVYKHIRFRLMIARQFGVVILTSEGVQD